MSKVQCCNIYEDSELIKASGETLRPGGFLLTEKAVNYCEFDRDHLLLDVGCGRGATIKYLKEKYNLTMYGIDPSERLLKFAQKNNPTSKIIYGNGEKIPSKNEVYKGIFAECALSLMENQTKAINEFYRVLKRDGYLVISDVYSKNPSETYRLKEFSLNSCVRGLIDIDKLQQQLIKNGFSIEIFQDYSELLMQFMVDIVFTYGSMNKFWSKASSCSLDSEKFKKVLKACKPGYFLIIAKKNWG